MDKRTFLKTSLIIGVSSLIDPINLLANPHQQIAFELPPLPYAFDALEPYIDKRTMEIHYGKHHKAYVDKLNKAIEGTPYENSKLENILASINPEDEAIRNNGGGHYNHTLFWQILSLQSRPPQGKLLQAINKHFTSLENFKTQFTKLALDHFGSGWVWLVVNNQNKLAIVETMNQDNPLMTKIVDTKDKGTPIFGLDVWEHAYYLKYQNRRADYVRSFWNIVNWQEVEKRFDALEKQRIRKWGAASEN